MFDTSKLTNNNKKILSDFFIRRELFDKYIMDNKLKLFTCPGCGYPTLPGRGHHEICDVCNWQDDYQDDKEADEVWGGPNGHLFLTENRINIGRILEGIGSRKRGQIITDPAEVLVILQFYADKKENISSKMTGKETIEHPLWSEWLKVEGELQHALVK